MISSSISLTERPCLDSKGGTGEWATSKGHTYGCANMVHYPGIFRCGDVWGEQTTPCFKAPAQVTTSGRNPLLPRTVEQTNVVITVILLHPNRAYATKQIYVEDLSLQRVLSLVRLRKYTIPRTSCRAHKKTQRIDGELQGLQNQVQILAAGADQSLARRARWLQER